MSREFSLVCIALVFCAAGAECWITPYTTRYISTIERLSKVPGGCEVYWYVDQTPEQAVTDALRRCQSSAPEDQLRELMLSQLAVDASAPTGTMCAPVSLLDMLEKVSEPLCWNRRGAVRQTAREYAMSFSGHVPSWTEPIYGSQENDDNYFGFRTVRGILMAMLSPHHDEAPRALPSQTRFYPVERPRLAHVFVMDTERGPIAHPFILHHGEDVEGALARAFRATEISKDLCVRQYNTVTWWDDETSNGITKLAQKVAKLVESTPPPLAVMLLALHPGESPEMVTIPDAVVGTHNGQPHWLANAIHLTASEYLSRVNARREVRADAMEWLHNEVVAAFSHRLVNQAVSPYDFTVRTQQVNAYSPGYHFEPLSDHYLVQSRKNAGVTARLPLREEETEISFEACGPNGVVKPEEMLFSMGNTILDHDGETRLYISLVHQRFAIDSTLDDPADLFHENPPSYRHVVLFSEDGGKTFDCKEGGRWKELGFQRIVGANEEESWPRELGVFLDTNPLAPRSQRYKLVVYAPHPLHNGLYAFSSEDGFSWELMQNSPIMEEDDQEWAPWAVLSWDTLPSIFFDGFAGRYRMFHRANLRSNVRFIQSAESPDFITWTLPVIVNIPTKEGPVLSPFIHFTPEDPLRYPTTTQNLDPIGYVGYENLYTPGVSHNSMQIHGRKVKHMLVALPARCEIDRRECDIFPMLSRDGGRSWFRPSTGRPHWFDSQYAPYDNPTDLGSFETGSVPLKYNMIACGGFVFNGDGDSHFFVHDGVLRMKSAIVRYRLAGGVFGVMGPLEAGQPAELRTLAILVPHGVAGLAVGVCMPADGNVATSLRVVVEHLHIDDAGNHDHADVVLPQAQGQCILVIALHDIAHLEGRTVRLRFEMSGVSLSGFAFQPEVQPS